MSQAPSNTMKNGLLLINLGTPAEPSICAVRSYLRAFLSDPRVIDLPLIPRLILLYAFILPFRPKQSAHAYQAIWTTEGSPLLINSERLTQKVRERLQASHQVELGMRYGQPSLQAALDALQTVDNLTIIPLFPQYASATTGSCIEWIMDYFRTKKTIPTLHILRDFYHHPQFIEAQAALIQAHAPDAEHLLLSYHGIPTRQLKTNHCDVPCATACSLAKNAACYRAQCHETTRLLTEKLALPIERYTTSFQSRLGRTEWIKPYTDETLVHLAAQGIQKLAIVCPSFTADCLETLEEIGIRARQQWQNVGGQSLTLIPCVNDSALFVDAIVEMAHHSH